MILKFEPTLAGLLAKSEKPWFVIEPIEHHKAWQSIPDILKYIEQQCNHDTEI